MISDNLRALVRSRLEQADEALDVAQLFLTGSYTFSNVREGQPVTTQTRFSFAYRLRDGRWLIVDHHSSAVPAPRQ
jgi:hypothetical protein